MTTTVRRYTPAAVAVLLILAAAALAVFAPDNAAFEFIRDTFDGLVTTMQGIATAVTDFFSRLFTVVFGA